MIDTGVRHLYTAGEAEQKLRIKAATVRSWARRKRIYSYGLDELMRPMYDKADLVRLRDRMQTRDQHERSRRASQRPRAHTT